MSLSAITRDAQGGASKGAGRRGRGMELCAATPAGPHRRQGQCRPCLGATVEGQSRTAQRRQRRQKASSAALAAPAVPAAGGRRTPAAESRAKKNGPQVSQGHGEEGADVANLKSPEQGGILRSDIFDNAHPVLIAADLHRRLETAAAAHECAGASHTHTGKSKAMKYAFSPKP